MLRIAVFLIALLFAHSAFARCDPNNKVGLPYNCDIAVTPNLSDVVMAGQNRGTGDTAVQMSLGQIVGADHSTSLVTPLNSVVTKTLAELFATPINIAGIPAAIGGTIQGEGNGLKLLTFCGADPVAGNALTTNAEHCAVDSGTVPSGGSGGGGVTGVGPNTIPYYPGAAASLSPLTAVPSSILTYDASSVPAFRTTLPTGLTIPSPSLTGASLLGTTNAAILTVSGKTTLAPSTSGLANLNIGQGVGPTSGSNGDEWVAVDGLHAWYAGAAHGPFGTLQSLTFLGPLSGGTLTQSGSIGCPTCATTVNGGALSGVSPIAVSSSGAISLGVQPRGNSFVWGSNNPVTNDTWTYSANWPSASATISELDYQTGSGSFSVSLQIDGVNITGCNSKPVTPGALAKATCTGANTIAKGHVLTAVTSGASGSPAPALVGVLYSISGS